MNVARKRRPAEAENLLGLTAFYRAVFSSEFAVYIIRFDDEGIARFEDANQAIATISNRPVAQIIGQRPIDVLPAEIGTCLETKLAECFASGERLHHERSVETPGGEVAFRTSLVPILDRDGKLEHILGMTRDVSSEADLARDAQQNAALLQRLGIAFPGAIYLLNLGDRSFRYIGGAGNSMGLAWRKTAEESGEDAALRYIHPDDLPKALDHLRELADLADGEVSTVEFQVLNENREYHPIRNRETVFSRNAKGEVELVLGVSEDVTDRDRVEQQVRDLSQRLLTSQIDERRRIAEDLHDSTGQHLFAVGLALARARASQVAPGRQQDGRAILIEALDDARHSLQIAQREVRMLSYLLHPPEIVSEGLSEAIRNFARGFAKRSGHYVEVHVDPAADTIDDEVSLNLFRACQEALTNVYRHADASRAIITLEVGEAEVTLEVADDGIGLDPSRALGVGLSGMQERTRRLGGEARLSSGPDGTTLLVTIPRSASVR